MSVRLLGYTLVGFAAGLAVACWAAGTQTFGQVRPDLFFSGLGFIVGFGIALVTLSTWRR